VPLNADQQARSAEQYMRRIAQEEAQSAVRQVREMARAAAQQETWSAEQHVRTVAQEEAQSVARQVQKMVQEAAQQEIRSAKEYVRTVAQEEAQSAARKVRERVPPAAHDSGRVGGRLGFRRIASRFGTAVVLPVILTLITALVTSSYVSSRLFDKAFRGGTNPVSIKVFYDRDIDVQGLTWVLPRGLGPLSAADYTLLSEATQSVDEFNDWIRSIGGVDVNYSFIKLIVTGQRQSGVVITDMRAKNDKCGNPLGGTLLFAPAESERQNIQIGFNLDEPSAIAREGNSNKKIGEPGYLGRPYFKSHTIPLALGEDQVFSIVAATKQHYCPWYIDMTVIVGDEKRHIEVGFKREGAKEQAPFEITALIDRLVAKAGILTYNQYYRSHEKSNPKGFSLMDPQDYWQ
jgi:hypothetical protein